MTCLTKQEQSFSSWGVRVFSAPALGLSPLGQRESLHPQMVSAWRLPRRPGGSLSFLPLPKRVCIANMVRQGTSFILDVWYGRGKVVGSFGEVTFWVFEPW